MPDPSNTEKPKREGLSSSEPIYQLLAEHNETLSNNTKALLRHGMLLEKLCFSGDSIPQEPTDRRSSSSFQSSIINEDINLQLSVRSTTNGNNVEENASEDDAIVALPAGVVNENVSLPQNTNTATPSNSTIEDQTRPTSSVIPDNPTLHHSNNNFAISSSTVTNSSYVNENISDETVGDDRTMIAYIVRSSCNNGNISTHQARNNQMPRVIPETLHNSANEAYQHGGQRENVSHDSIAISHNSEAILAGQNSHDDIDQHLQLPNLILSDLNRSGRSYESFLRFAIEKELLKRSNKNLSYSRNHLEKALSKVVLGGISYSKVCDTFKIPRSTLSPKVQNVRKLARELFYQ